MDEYLPMFLNDAYCEAFGPWRENENFGVIYKQTIAQNKKDRL
jgi:hypothetical protein